ncbi:hypothetical protein ASPWEDRAFT_22499 [Aspergillus wentii DTO 134E9]|uniref:Uncharacterized protein n=1 Tax=Aspergillus wentii DTO 134E9 TaxID=1073089 RepID=A0A1L9RZL3_ASPWE|nr:uncharacterized protein ASPWEDRAFT_22499 [Aspergillus wentii DTO 134E9]OJJ40304.1 hypothetical protein ASPWEDRAFT_22499 [Aspergillus wentii DTO 134E9]
MNIFELSTATCPTTPLSPEEAELLWPGAGTTMEFVGGRYNNSRKDPDFFLRADDDNLPRFVIESGWSESWTRLLHATNLWLVGGNGKVRAVLVGESWRIKREPPQGTQQQVTLPRRVLFGPHILQGQDPNFGISLGIRSLRRIATRALRFEGLVPD